MAAPVLTASRVDLFRECAYSILLPHTYERSDAADRGTEVHALVLRPGCLPQVALDWFGGREPRYEATLAVEVLPRTDADGRDFGRVAYLGCNLNRAYDLPDPVEGGAWVAGTADAVQVAGSCMSVADLKTGFGQCRGSLPHPSRSGQLLLLAGMLAAWRGAGGSGEPGVRWTAPRSPGSGAAGVAAGASTPWQPEPAPEPPARDPGAAVERVRLAWVLHPEDGPTRVEDAEVEPAALSAWMTKLAARVRHAVAGSPDMRPGHHCAHCPCFDACPAQGGALRRLSELGDGLLTVEDAAVVAAAVPAAERQIQSARRALRLFVERQGAGQDLPIGNGRALRVVRGSRRDVDATVALRSGIVGLQQARVTVSQASIRDGDPACDVDAVMAALEGAGAVTHVQTAPHVRVVRDNGAADDV